MKAAARAHALLTAALAEPSLWDEANAALERAGFDLGDGSSEAIAAAWTKVYRDSDRWFDLYQLAEKLVDIDDALAGWRHKHVLTVDADHRQQDGHRRIGRRVLSRVDAVEARFPRTMGAENRSLSFKPLFSREPRRRARAAALRRAQPSFVARRQLRRPGRVLGRCRPPRRPQMGPGDGRGVARGAGPCRGRAWHRHARRRSCSRPTPMISSSALPRPARAPIRRRLRVLTSDGEFHQARRQFARWAEDGWFELETVAAEPFDDFSDALPRRGAQSASHDLIFVSQMLFGSGRRFDGVDELAALARPDGPVGRDRRLSRLHGARAAVRAGAPRRAPSTSAAAINMPWPGRAARSCTPARLWRAAAADRLVCRVRRSDAAAGHRSAMPSDAMRFMGATFDPSALYRFNARAADARRQWADHGAHFGPCRGLQAQLLEAIAGTALGAGRTAQPARRRSARSLPRLPQPDAQRWCAELAARDCVTDVRGDVLRIGLGLYHDEEDVDAFAALAAKLA